MSPVVVKSLIGIVGLGVASVGGYGIYYVSQKPSNIKEQLIYENLKITSFEGNDGTWKTRAQTYKDSSDKKIAGVEINNHESDFTKLRDECKKLLAINLKVADAKTKLVQAKQWCVDTSTGV